MADREKVEKALDCRANGSELDCRDCAYYIREDTPAYCNFRQILRDALALLKEQEEKPLRCKTCTMRDRTGFCHRWNREVKDDDYCSFGAWKGC